MICRKSLKSLNNVVLNMALTATPCRYRLIDCNEFIKHKRLCIYEYIDFPPHAYTAISYVWRGLQPNPASLRDERGSFNVVGAEDGDPISIDLLIDACTMSVREGLGYLWLDRLCILQTSRDDKAWQIIRMVNIYQSCGLCLVLPGGLRRLADLWEQTAWIERAWTLQEAMVPERVMILFAWEFGSGSYYGFFDREGISGSISEVTRGKSAVSPMAEILSICATEGERLNFFPDDGDSVEVPPRPIDPNTGLSTLDTPPPIFHPGPAHALQIALAQRVPETRESAVWRCALMRVSSRPVDMVFSIMGLFGVTLDPKAFHKDDRLHATVALMQGILRNGGTASWIGASMGARICQQLSTYAELPKPGDSFLQDTSVDDFEFTAHLKGRMDDEGYFQFSAKAAPVVPQKNARYKDFPKANDVPTKDLDGFLVMTVRSRVWRIQGMPGANPRVFVLPVGETRDTNVPEESDILLMLIEEHAPGRFHRVFFCVVSPRWKRIINGWKASTFSVGGPNKLGPRTL